MASKYQVPGSNGGGGLTVTVEGQDAVLKSFDRLSASLKKTANAEIRRASKDIAQGLLAPLRESAAGSGVPQAIAIAGTARAKSDRKVYVSVGTVNPVFRNHKWRATARKGAKAASHRVSVAFGSNYGPKGGHREGTPANYYTVPRNMAGYWIEPTVKRAAGDAADKYRTMLAQMMRKYGLI